MQYQCQRKLSSPSDINISFIRERERDSVPTSGGEKNCFPWSLDLGSESGGTFALIRKSPRFLFLLKAAIILWSVKIWFL